MTTHKELYCTSWENERFHRDKSQIFSLTFAGVNAMLNPSDLTCRIVIRPIIGNLSTRVFETRTATGREHFACQESGISQIFVLIISNGEKILSNVTVVE